MTTSTTASTTTPRIPSAVTRVITLLLVNLGLSAVLAILFAVFHNSLLDYQLSSLHPSTGDMAATRAGLSVGLWTRAATVVVIGIVYMFLVRRLRAGKRRAYLRVLVLSVASLAGIVYLATSGQYPSWVVAEQIVQAVVLIALLWAVTRPAVRAFFAKTPRTTA